MIGFADNVVVLAWALHSTVRIAGPDTVGRHWKGSPASLAALYRGDLDAAFEDGLKKAQAATSK